MLNHACGFYISVGGTDLALVNSSVMLILLIHLLLKKKKLISLFLAVLGLRCCSDVYLVSENGSCFLVGVQARCAACSLWWLLLWNTGSRACGFQQLQPPGSRAQVL